MTRTDWQRLAWGSSAALVVVFLLTMMCRLGNWAASALIKGAP